MLDIRRIVSMDEEKKSDGKMDESSQEVRMEDNEEETVEQAEEIQDELNKSEDCVEKSTEKIEKKSNNLTTLENMLKMIEERIKESKGKKDTKDESYTQKDNKPYDSNLNNLVDKLNTIQRSTNKHERSRSKGSVELNHPRKQNTASKSKDAAHSHKFESLFRELESKASKKQLQETASQRDEKEALELGSDIKDLLSDSKGSLIQNFEPPSVHKIQGTSNMHNNHKYMPSSITSQLHANLNTRPTGQVPKDISKYFEDEKQKIIRRVHIQVSKGDHDQASLNRRVKQPAQRENKFEQFKKKYWDSDMKLRSDKLKILKIDKVEPKVSTTAAVSRKDYFSSAKEEPKQLNTLIRKLEALNRTGLHSDLSKNRLFDKCASVARLQPSTPSLAAKRMKTYGSQTRLILGSSPKPFKRHN